MYEPQGRYAFWKGLSGKQCQIALWKSCTNWHSRQQCIELHFLSLEHNGYLLFVKNSLLFDKKKIVFILF